jgi:hypothetical protein
MQCEGFVRLRLNLGDGGTSASTEYTEPVSVEIVACVCRKLAIKRMVGWLLIEPIKYHCWIIENSHCCSEIVDAPSDVGDL